jgi:hypothetical protein
MSYIHSSRYSQDINLSNLPHLQASLLRSQIPHVLLGETMTTIAPQEQAHLVIEVLLSEEGLKKLHQVFVGQRFVAVGTVGERFFWDSRTGLTIRVYLPHERSVVETTALATAETNLGKCQRAMPLHVSPTSPWMNRRVLEQSLERCAALTYA